MRRLADTEPGRPTPARRLPEATAGAKRQVALRPARRRRRRLARSKTAGLVKPEGRLAQSHRQSAPAPEGAKGNKARPLALALGSRRFPEPPRKPKSSEAAKQDKARLWCWAKEAEGLRSRAARQGAPAPRVSAGPAAQIKGGILQLCGIFGRMRM